LETNQRKGYFIHEKKDEGDTLKTVFFIIDNDYFLSKFDVVTNEQQYNASIKKNESPSNSLENYVYYCLKSCLNDLQLTTQTEDILFPKSNLNSFSCVEYFSVIPNSDNKTFVVWKSSSNTNDNKNVVIDISENDKVINKIGYLQRDSYCFYHTVDFKPNCSYAVNLREYNSNCELINKNVVEFDNISKLNDAGKFTMLNTNVSLSIKTSSKFNLHHYNFKNESLAYVSNLVEKGLIYRSHLNCNEVDIFKTINNYNESHIIFKNVKLSVTVDEFMCTIHNAREYMYDNDLILVALESSGGAVGGISNFYKSKGHRPVSAYLINNNYLSTFKTIGSMSELNSYLKGYCVNSVINIL